MTPTIPQIQQAVAEHYGITIADLTGRGRQRGGKRGPRRPQSPDLIRPRWLCWHICQGRGGYSVPGIAAAFNRSPLAVLYGLARFSVELMEEGPDGELANALLTIYARLAGQQEVAS